MRVCVCWCKSVYRYEDIHRWINGSKCPRGFFSYDIIIFPMFTPGHWRCAIADFRIRTCLTFDSFGKVLERRDVRWMGQVFKDHATATDQEFNVVDWKFDATNPCPQQDNNDDCGVMTLRVAEHYTRGAALEFAVDRPKLAIELYKKVIIIS